MSYAGTGRRIAEPQASGHSGLRLCDEGVEAFGEVGAEGVVDDDVGGERVGLLEAELELAVEGPLAERQDGSRLVEQSGAQGGDGVIELVGAARPG